ncbi:uncharacterized protein [Haliotis cracherodii]|uniref:uncharacterized protein n=1 Tax=Haliotis cracherodii TaxID=6455 RepID=UPI0039EAB0B6
MYPHLQNLPLPAISDAKPLILIGSDNADLILPLQPVRAGPQGTPVAIYTRLGWSLQGPCASESNRKQHCILTRTLHEPQLQITDDVERLWKINILPYTTKQVTRSKLDHFAFKTLEDKTVKVTVDSEIHHVIAVDWAQKTKRNILMCNKQFKIQDGGFNIRQWISNDPDVVKDLPSEARSETCELWLMQGNTEPHEGTLGLRWQCEKDCITYKYRPIAYSTLTLNVVYRILASQYDPLGFLTPYLARAKVIVQQLWQHKPQWGEPLPECELLTEWHLWESELKLMNQVSLPRCIDPPEPVNQRQLHIFCDASEKVYGSVAYLKSETNDGSSHVTFVAARSRVAPKKALSMPRLELLAAQTGAQLASTLTSEMTIDIHKVIMWNPNHNVTKLLIKKYDSELHHYGAERRKFWILQGHEAVKKHQRQCHDCQKWRANPEIPLMADLPEARLRLFKAPFYSTGIDCFGPMYIKIGRRREKRYGIIFKCMTTRAVHIDILDSLDTDAFLMALRRFISRRGCPFELLSDCGTNFKGGENELCKAFEAMNYELKEKLAKNHIRFQFNPPFAPHFGGLWEREIRSIKYGQRSILGTESVSESVLRTVMTEVESILNSKPLGYTSSDISNTDPVSPYTLLIGRSDPALPQVVYLNEDRLTKKRFRQSQVLADNFWRKFIKEYLPNLQQRVKWMDELRNVQTDDVVLIIDHLHTRSEWKIGQVIETYAGSDGRERSAKVKTSDNEILRPVSKLIKLPKYD